MTEEVYVGIDVSQAELVVAVRPSGELVALANDRAGIKRLVGRLDELKPQLVVVEATGRIATPGGGGGCGRRASRWRRSIHRGCATLPKAAELGPRLTARTPSYWRCLRNGNGPSQVRRQKPRPRHWRTW